jgi:hypothetical protein
MTTLEQRKIALLIQIDRLKREIDRLKWLEYREIALYNCTGSVVYVVTDRLWEKSDN